MRKLKVLSLTVFVLMFMSGMNNDFAFASEVKSSLLDDQRMKLTLDQVNSLARLLKEVEKNDISPCTYSKEIQSDDPSHRIILTLLAPKIQEQIKEYYKNKLTESPTFAPYLGGNKLEVNYFSSGIGVKVTVIPYVGPHISVGKELIEFRIDNGGRVEAVKYDHIEEYNLPPNWEFIIKCSVLLICIV